MKIARKFYCWKFSDLSIEAFSMLKNFFVMKNVQNRKSLKLLVSSFFVIDFAKLSRNSFVFAEELITFFCHRLNTKPPLFVIWHSSNVYLPIKLYQIRNWFSLLFLSAYPLSKQISFISDFLCPLSKKLP